MGIIVTGSRHSIRPSLNLDFANSKVLDPRITFTRASNATYYDGYTSVKAEENLVSYSQEFDNAYWSKGNVTTTPNDTTAPDGTTTAESLADNTSTGTSHMINGVFGSFTTGTFSVYLKANASSYCAIGLDGSSTRFAGIGIDLSTGTITNTFTGGGATINSSSITDVGNGWYRAVITATSIFTTARILLSNASTPTWSSYGLINYDSTSSNSIYIWGAQLEQRDTATAYTPTTSSPITNYVPALQTAGNNVARFDHNPTTGESLGLLIEESRTNLITNSTTMAYGSSPYATVGAIVPDGTYSPTACPIPFTGSNRYQHSIPAGTYANGTVLTFSWYAKALEGWGGNLSTDNGGFAFSAPVGLSISNIVKIADSGNGWERWSCQVTITDNSITQLLRAYFGAEIPAFTIRYAYWGFQLEPGTFATSYIKTTGSQVTRSADGSKIANINTSEWFKQGEGTLFVEVGDNNKWQGYFPRALTIVNDAKTNFIQFRKKIGGATPTSNITIDLTMNNYATTYYNHTSINGISKKLVLSYKRNDSASITNLNSINTDTTVEIPSDFTELHLGQYNADATNITGSRFNTTLRKLSYYPLRLTDNEIQDLSEE